ncbi:MAG: rRNA pseudouridine synthase [Nitrospina sp.]|jgi:23S rRNA pseudouridine2605 synthase|nr:rRNA pseudouridine synthase [Nitrospina sp.]MBT6716477.1 rRNA pseudouridine synthase [Nitrospina sp.]
MKIRLQKIIADAGLASRREAERWIEEGIVKVNGKVVTQLGSLADPSTDQIKVSGKVVPQKQDEAYVVLNKPTGCLTTMAEDKRGRTTVMEYVKITKVRVFPVGRLDFNTQGVLLFTNDGVLAKKLLLPKYKVERTYKVKVSGMPNEKTLKRLARGVHIDGEKFKPISAKIQKTSGKNCFLIMTLVEGKNRHIKKVCEHIGHPVIKLQRTHFGGLNLTGLPLGACRFLSMKEVKSLKKLVIEEPTPARPTKKKR